MEKLDPGSGIWDGKKSDPGSGIYIQDPQHSNEVTFLLTELFVLKGIKYLLYRKGIKNF
jgi:hypothetical protein